MATNKELLEHLVTTVDRVDTKVDQLDGKVDSHGERLASIEAKIEGHKELHTSLEKRDLWSAGTGIIAAIVAAFIGTQK